MSKTNHHPPAVVRAIVPVHGGLTTLRHCLDTLRKSQITLPIEIVVVDDGENDNLDSVIAGFPVEVRRNPEAGSAARARNRGAAGFTGEVLVFVDADVLVEPGALQLLVDPILNGTAQATVGNYSRDVSGMGFAQQYKSLYLNRVYSWVQGGIRNEFWTALGAIRASVFSTLGGFATDFQGCLSEDTELGQRLTQAGHRIMAVPHACGRHLHRLGVWDLIANDLRKGNSTIRLFVQGGKPLSDFRHCRPRDMMAVGSACAMIPVTGFALAAPISEALGLAMMGYLAAQYVLCRSDLLASFVRQGAWFLGRATLMMYALDLVRAVCVGRGLAHTVTDRGTTLAASLVRRLARHLPHPAAHKPPVP